MTRPDEHRWWSWSARRAARQAKDDAYLSHFRGLNDQAAVDLDERLTRLNDLDNEAGHTATAPAAEGAIAYRLTPLALHLDLDYQRRRRM